MRLKWHTSFVWPELLVLNNSYPQGGGFSQTKLEASFCQVKITASLLYVGHNCIHQIKVFILTYIKKRKAEEASDKNNCQFYLSQLWWNTTLMALTKNVSCYLNFSYYLLTSFFYCVHSLPCSHPWDLFPLRHSHSEPKFKSLTKVFCSYYLILGSPMFYFCNQIN